MQPLVRALCARTNGPPSLKIPRHASYSTFYAHFLCYFTNYHLSTVCLCILSPSHFVFHFLCLGTDKPKVRVLQHPRTRRTGVRDIGNGSCVFLFPDTSYPPPHLHLCTTLLGALKNANQMGQANSGDLGSKLDIPARYCTTTRITICKLL